MLHAQDTSGKQFWLTFGKNSGANSVTDIDLQIRIVGGDKDAIVTLDFIALNSEITFSVAAGQVYTYDFNENQDNIRKEAVYNTTRGTSNRSVHITSTESITVYALNQKKNTTDATNILPLTSLGTDYYQISYKALRSLKF